MGIGYFGYDKSTEQRQHPLLVEDSNCKPKCAFTPESPKGSNNTRKSSFYTVTAEEHVCKTFGSGVIQMFNGTMFHVNSTCPMVMTHFSHGGVDSFISVQRNTTGVITKVKILVNKVETIIQNGVVTVEGKRISLPYDHFYQSVYNYGIYTRLQSKLFPLYLTWYNVSESVTSLWVQLNGPLVDGMMGICGNANSSETKAQLFTNIISDGACVITDSNANEDAECGRFRSPARPCLAEPQCPGDLRYMDEGLAFPPSCSSPKEQTDYRARTCVPPNGLVLNDRAEGYRAVRVEDCPCVYGGKTYSPGHTRTSKCQECVCSKGKWSCSANLCPTRCVIEGWFVTTFDGIQYSLLQKCTYLAAGEQNWSVAIKFSETDRTIEKLVFRVEKEEYTFSVNSAQLGEDKITDLSQTEHATVFWQSSMFIQVKTSFGLKMQVRVYPEIQMYLYLPPTTKTKGLCGTYNNKTEDDFTTSSGIIENSPQPFALSWVLSPCVPNEPPICNSDTEMYAEKKCGQLRNVSGVFARCHDYVPVNIYFDTCVQRTCQSTGKLEESVCLGLANYAKACGGQGINVEDWRAETGCTQTCESNLRFSYAMKACNRTCRSLTGPDPTCDVLDDPVEGCGCMVGTHLNMPLQCSPQDLCQCTYPGGMTRPGPVMIKGQHCMCENGILECSSACDCAQGKICVNCGHTPVITTQRTCESLSKPFSMDESCVSGCYCPDGLFEDHNGICVTRKSCTCKYGDVVYASGDRVESNCKTCTCEGGHWHCTGEPCPGACEVYGNGQYKTFDSKWYRFDGHCQYTLVQDVGGQFSIKSESVPCCDEALTCSRSITVELQNEVILVLRDMNVTEKFLSGWSLSTQQLYTVHTVGLYFIIDVPAMNLTVIWDKQTRVKIELKASWKGKLKGLCGDFDGRLVNDMTTRSSSVVFNTIEFGNSWKAAVPPCSDVTHEVFPCERHSYCSAWAQRRCMILHSDTFKDCQQKVDPEPYYQACVLESCSCEFEGKFLGFCTAVAAYAEACSAQNICIKWRTPDLCPVYCDYYNEEGQCSWHYEPCAPRINTCGKNSSFTGKLEGCYPRCPAEMPYFDENKRACTTLDNCTCYLNNTMLGPGDTFNTPDACWTNYLRPLYYNYHSSAYNYNSRDYNYNTSDHNYHSRDYNSSDYNYNSRDYNYNSRDYNYNTSDHNYHSRDYNSSDYNYNSRDYNYNYHSSDHNFNSRDYNYNYHSSAYNYNSRDYNYNTSDHNYHSRDYNSSDYNYNSRDYNYNYHSSDYNYNSRDYNYNYHSSDHNFNSRDYNYNYHSNYNSRYNNYNSSYYNSRDHKYNSSYDNYNSRDYNSRDHNYNSSDDNYNSRDHIYNSRDHNYNSRDYNSRDYNSSDYNYNSSDYNYNSRDYNSSDHNYNSSDHNYNSRDLNYNSRDYNYNTSDHNYHSRDYNSSDYNYNSRDYNYNYHSSDHNFNSRDYNYNYHSSAYNYNSRDYNYNTSDHNYHSRDYNSSDYNYNSRDYNYNYHSSDYNYNSRDYNYNYHSSDHNFNSRDYNYNYHSNYNSRYNNYNSSYYNSRDHKYNSSYDNYNSRDYNSRDHNYNSSDDNYNSRDHIYNSRDHNYNSRDYNSRDYNSSDYNYNSSDDNYNSRDYNSSDHNYNSSDHNYNSRDLNYNSRDYNYNSNSSAYNSNSRDYNYNTSDHNYHSRDYNSSDYNYNSRDYNYNSSDHNYNSRDYNYNSNSSAYNFNSRDYNYNSRDHNYNSSDHNYNTSDHNYHSRDSNSSDYNYNSRDFNYNYNSSDHNYNSRDYNYNYNSSNHNYNSRDYNYNSRDYNYNSSDDNYNSSDHNYNSRDYNYNYNSRDYSYNYNSSDHNYNSRDYNYHSSDDNYNSRDYNSRDHNYHSSDDNYNSSDHNYNSRDYNSRDHNYHSSDDNYNSSDHNYNSRDYNYNYNSRDYSYNYNSSDHNYNSRDYNYNYNSRDYSYNYNSSDHNYNSRDYNYHSSDDNSNSRDYNSRDHNYHCSDDNYNSIDHNYNSRDYNSRDHNYNSRDYNDNSRDYNSRDHNYNSRDHNYNSSDHNYNTINPRNYNNAFNTINPRNHISNKNWANKLCHHISPNCTDVKGNWPNGAQWTEGCINKTCNNGEIMKSPVSCQEPDKPTCPKGQPQLVKEDQGCCDIWQCERNCTDLRRNQNWPSGAQWTEDCFSKTCNDSVIMASPVTCPESVKPTCLKGQPQLVKDEQGCCETWRCDCQCEVYGDPHYNSFSSTTFDFLENCTYTLVEEKTPRHHLRISIDTYYCEPLGSCVRGVIVKYHNNTVLLEVEPEDEVKALLNQQIIQPPYNQDGIRFEGSERDISVYIDKIRSYVSLSMFNTLRIKLASEHFSQNTHGQCGVCGGPSCTRRDGTIESESCCNMTAYEWIEDDPQKPYCQRTRQNVSCTPDIPPPPPPTICKAPLCDILRHEIFKSCSQDTDVETMVKNCKFDYCLSQKNITVCSPLESLADHCKKSGVCVAWRNLTDGICDITCPEGMQFDECRDTPVKVCHGGVAENVTDSMRSGCFCPDDQVLAGKHKQICVSECTNCKGPLGEPMPIGATWESNCHTCTCNNQTRTEECQPKPTPPTPTCRPGFTITTDCCDNPTCVEKTCEYNGTIYKVGESWKDHTDPCVTFSCTSEGTEMQKSVCPEQNCSEEFRVWDKNHCCYTCEVSCQVRLTRMKVALDNCTKEVDLPRCGGYCDSKSLWVRSGEVLQLEQDQLCCQMGNYEMKEISLECSGAPPTKYSYKHITNCDCKV
ncbi:uncharacterized protein LOC134328769 [Trichomycterus rosablanca]|uniref:uncharacterized protein LOC134328769 n=1 Tax=Trichomycterus rosablanca TaxID=2290929 RepID=UPI002F354DE2